jgi:hypothetical protein
MPDQPRAGDGRASAVATPAAAPAQEEITLVLMLEEEAPASAPRPRRARPEPTTTMEVMVPEALAQELKQALSVLPGLSLDALAAQALARVLSDHGAPRLASRRRAAESLVVLV